MAKYLGGCEKAMEDLGFRSPHCDSCHYEDEEFGYGMSTIYVGNDYYEVCCRVSNEWEDKKNSPETSAGGEE